MAEYCKLCSIRYLGPQSAKYAGGLCKRGEITDMLCEGCGRFVTVDHEGMLVRVGMKIRAIVAGTGFEGRERYIKRFAQPGMKVQLRREPSNPKDENAVAVDLPVKRWQTLFQEVPVQIGYIKSARAKSMAAKMDEGGKILSAKIESMDLYLNHPRVSIEILTDW